MRPFAYRAVCCWCCWRPCRLRAARAGRRPITRRRPQPPAVPMPRRGLRRASYGRAILQSRHRRSRARLRVRPGRREQFLFRRCRGLREYRADRTGRGTRADGAGPRGGGRRAAARRFRPRSACQCRGRSLSAVLHSRRGQRARPISLSARHDVETAIAIAGGYSPRADKRNAMLTRTINGAPAKSKVPLQTQLRPGDTVNVAERWF